MAEGNCAGAARGEDGPAAEDGFREAAADAGVAEAGGTAVDRFHELPREAGEIADRGKSDRW